MTKIVYNKGYSEFNLSNKAVERYFELKGWELNVINEYGRDYYIVKHTGEYWFAHNLERDDPILVRVVEELIDEANYRDSSSGTTDLAIRELPVGTKYIIMARDAYDREKIVTQDEFVWRIAR